MATNWRVGHQGRDGMYYEERVGGRWERIEIDGEMLMGPAHHVIYFASPDQWLKYPEWARHRRDEIIARIKSEFRVPDYEYNGDAPGVASPAAEAAASVAPQTAPAASTAHRPRQPVQGLGALRLAIVLCFLFGAAMAWVATSGVMRGTTSLPTKQASGQRVIARADDPVMFWVCIGIYGALSGGAVVLGVLAMREGAKLTGRMR